MKKLFTLAAALLISFSLMAQDEGEANRFWLGGGIGFGSFSAQDVTIAPSFGLMFGDQLGAGIDLNFQFGNTDSWSLTPFVRYYLPVADRFSFYGDGYVGFGHTGTDGFFSLGVRAGMQFWFTPNWSMAASAGIIDFTSSGGNSEVGVGADFSGLNLALFFHF